jgi:hypothetical protein
VSPREPPGDAARPPPAQPLPEPVRELIVGRIDSVADLEALQLLRNEPQRHWDEASVARRLYIDEARAGATLKRLAQRGLAASVQGSWHYAPETPAVADAVQALCDIYSQRLVAITALIHGKTARGIEEFARAFVIRRKE